MKGIAFLFFFTGAAAVMLGMLWGIHMAISGDHTMAPAHAHLNLVGWASMALIGLYYHCIPAAAANKLARVHYPLALAGLVVMVPGITIVLKGGTEAFAAIGSILTALSMLLFLVIVATSRNSA